MAEATKERLERTLVQVEFNVFAPLNPDQFRLLNTVQLDYGITSAHPAILNLYGNPVLWVAEVNARLQAFLGYSEYALSVYTLVKDVELIA